MKKITCHYKLVKYIYLKYTFLSLFVLLLLAKGLSPLEQTGNNFFHIFIDDVEIGTTYDENHARELVSIARKNVVCRGSEITFIDATVDIVGEEVMWGVVDGDEEIITAAENILETDIIETMQRGYSVKVNDFIVNLASVEEVKKLFQAVVDKFDDEDSFEVELVANATHEFNVLTTAVVKKEDFLEKEVASAVNTEGGVEKFFSDSAEIMTEKELDFSDYELGIHEIRFVEEVEIAESYLPVEKLDDINEAISELTMDQEKPVEYEVVAGDTLSAISIKVGIPMEDIVNLNSDVLENVNTTINVGQKLIITVPEPSLSVERVEERYFEEIYDADVVYIDRDDWYTYNTQVIQQPSAGFRKIVADVYFLNEKEVSREILKEEIVMEAVPMIMERGTKIPPTYIKPVTGGVISSGFGYRNINVKGATSNHGAIDWAVPKGTPVYASCGGTVVRSGWSSSYGYCIYINHEDGRQTRYAHLSKLLVSVGQTVKQGEKIALSGSTGVSSGPHLHFEILINGVRVNPLLYLE